MIPAVSPVEALVLAVVQGVTELFPVSSLGHAVILPALLHWGMKQDDPGFLPFLVVMHLGTAVALLAYFWRDWWDFGRAVLFNQGANPADERRVFLRVVAATIPAVIVGALLEHFIRGAFARPALAAGFLILNGVMLFASERMRRPSTEGGRRALADLSVIDALVIGAWQCLALIPGLSRSGATMVGGYRAGLDHEDAARFSFLTGTPIILAAAVHEAPKLMKQHTGFSGVQWGAGAVAGVVALASLYALMRWFKTREFKAFDPFAYYCWAAGAVSLALLVFMR